MTTVEPPTRRTYSPKELAAMIGRDQSTIHRWFDRKLIRGFQLAPHCEVMIPADEVKRVCTALGVPCPA